MQMYIARCTLALHILVNQLIFCCLWEVYEIGDQQLKGGEAWEGVLLVLHKLCLQTGKETWPCSADKGVPSCTHTNGVSTQSAQRKLNQRWKSLIGCLLRCTHVVEFWA